MRQKLFKKWGAKVAFLLFAVALGLSLSTSMTLSASASFTVNSSADGTDANPGDGVCATTDGVCTLRAAIQESNALAGDDTITLPAGTYLLTMGGVLEDKGAFGDLDITGNLILTGEEAESTIIDGNALDRVLHVADRSAVVEMSGITIRNGNTPFSGGGGGIRNQGTLTLNDSIVTSNTSEENGGGINNQGALTVGNSSISHNRSDDDGGGLYNSGMLTLNDTMIHDNDRRGIHNEGSLLANNSTIIQNEGRGIYNSWSMILSGCTIHDNPNSGIHNEGTLELTNSTVSNNSGSEGGGISNRGRLTLNNSTISDNNATNNGGAIFNTFYGQVTLNHSTISNNTANLSGGAIYNPFGNLIVNKSTISGNSAGSDGGGIYNDDGATLNNSTISGNHANLNGGGIYHGLGESNQLNLNNVTITNNTADRDGDDSGDGGGLFNNIGLVNLQNTIIAGNQDNSPTTQHNDCSAVRPVSSQGYNLIQDMTGCLVSGDTTSNLTGISPNLGALENNGGSTLTHALLPDSPAIDAGNPAGCTDQNGTPLNGDQVGSPRTLDGNEDGTIRCDIGAYEVNNFKPTDFAYLPIVEKGRSGGVIPSSSSAILAEKPNSQQVLSVWSILGIGLFLGTCVFAFVLTVQQEDEDEYWYEEQVSVPIQKT
ncbi:MAG: choice-of-anchor Q domain-containing protein [Ardenticatenaceae bacterium]